MKRLQVFLTVGSQMPFDRLTDAVARWSRQRPAVAVTAQIGASALAQNSLQPMQWTSTLDADAYSRQCEQAQLIVAHAGMGSILTALDLDRPLVILPRRGHLQETRNDHQLHTARQLQRQQARELAFSGGPSRGLRGVEVALDEAELPAVLDRVCMALLADHAFPIEPGLRGYASSGCSSSAGDTLNPTESAPARAALIHHLQTLIRSVRPG